MTTLSCRSAHLTYRGRRPANQDAVIALWLPGDRELLAVADGTGGHHAGEVASTTAIEILARELHAGAGFAEAIQRANAAIHAMAGKRASSRDGMATTLVALLRTGATYEIANVGDSRAYLLQTASIEQVTLDHSFVAEAVRTGGMSPEAAARSPWRNLVTRALGVYAEVEIDLFGPFEIGLRPHAILLCSDGLYKALDDDAIHRCALAAEDASAAASTLSSFGFLAGSTDNITVALMEFGALFRSSEVPTAPYDGRALRAGAPIG